MEKQKKQLLGLLVILIVAVIAFIVVKNLPQYQYRFATPIPKYRSYI